MAVSAGSAYLDVAPRIARTFSRDLTQQMVRPMAQVGAQAGERAGDESGRRFGRRFSGGVRAGIGPVRGVLRGFGPALAAAFGGAAIAASIKSVTDEAREAAAVGRVTEARLRSTGGAANVTARQISDLAEALSNKVGVDDDVIQAGQNMLLTFKGVRNEAGRGNDIFNQATRAAVDLAAGMNQGRVDAKGLQTANIQLGKALEDPVRGMTALRRSGVSFTKAQQDQIKTLVESGRTLDAQKLILRAVNEQFAGSAAASTDAGKRFGVFIGNLKERIGAALLPVLNRLLGFLVDRLPGAIATVSGWFRRAALGVRALGLAFRGEGVTSDGFVGVMERIGVAARAVVGWFQRTATAASRILGPAIRSIVEALRPAIAAFVAGLMPGLRTLGAVVQRQVWPALKILAAIIGVTLYAALRFVLPFILRLAGPVLGFLFRQIAQTIQWVSNVIRWIGRLAAGFLRWITGTKTTGDAVRVLGERVGRFATSVKRNWDSILSNVRTVIGGLKSAWNGFVTFLGGLRDKIASKVKGAMNAGIGVINTFIRGVNRVGNILLPGSPINIPQIARLQRGGIVGGRGTGDRTLILGEPGEVVIPNRTGDRRRLLRDPKVAERLGLDVGGDPAALRLLGFQRGGVIPPGGAGRQAIRAGVVPLVVRAQQFIRAQDPKPYVWGGTGPGGWDCSGLVGAVYGLLTGRSPYQRYFTTASIGGAQGFRPGRGAFTVGVTAGQGHMAGNLAGLAFEARSSRSGILVGDAARSVTSFARQYFLPQIGGRFMAGGGLLAALLGRLLGAILRPARAGLAALGDSPLAMLVRGGGSTILDAGEKLLRGGIFDRGGALAPHSATLAINRTSQWEPVGFDYDRLARAIAANPPVVELDGRRMSPIIRKQLRSMGYRDGRTAGV